MGLAPQCCGISTAHLWLSATIIFVPEAASRFRSVTKSSCAPQLISITIWACTQASGMSATGQHHVRGWRQAW